MLDVAPRCSLAGTTPPVSGEGAVQLVGAEGLVRALSTLDGQRFALVGGLAVMARIGRVHRATEDLDGVFDNDSSTPTTALLVDTGHATPDAAPQRVLIAGTTIDVIDTAPLPQEPALLPDDPGPRLFVCAHRFAYETASPVAISAGTSAVDPRVATVAALIAMKAHALRFGHPRRRSTKRVSDLADLHRLAAMVDPSSVTRELGTTAWRLDRQVRDALAEDVMSDPELAVALLRRSAVPEIASTDPDDFVETIGALVEALGA